MLLLHGWPGAPIEFLELVPALVGAGHDVIVPSLPGFAFSDAPEPPLNVAGVSARLRELVAALGYDRYAIQGGDWGSIIGARMAFDDPGAVAGLHLNAPGVLPLPGDLSEPPMTEAEAAFVQEAQRWRLREGFHLLAQGAAPDALAPGLHDSPAGLAAWLVDKYRRWSDCGGEVERRFSKDELCDFLTLYWVTGTIASSMRIYAAEARDRWRLAAGERIEVPAAVADFPAELVRPPREWSRAGARRPAPVERVRPRRTLRRLRGARAARRRPDRVPGRALSASLTLALIADTHLPRGRRRLPEACVERLRAADLVVHAGDFSTVAAYEAIAVSAASSSASTATSTTPSCAGACPSASSWSSAACAWA